MLTRVGCGKQREDTLENCSLGSCASSVEPALWAEHSGGDDDDDDDDYK